MKLSDLTEHPQFRVLCGTADKDVKALQYQSDKCMPQDAFFALQGRDRNGQDFVADAYAHGAETFFTEDGPRCIRSLPKEAKNITVVETKNARAALAFCAAKFYRKPAEQLLTIGITGTKGKTTTAFMLQKMLQGAGIPTGIIGTVRCGYEEHYSKSPNTTPESCEIQRMLREMADGGCRAVVMEVSSQGLKYHRTDEILFDYAVFTNLSPDHIGYGEHASFEEYRDCKSRLFARCRTAVLHREDPGCAAMEAACEKETKKLYFGGNSPGAFMAESIRPVRRGNRLGSEFLMLGPDFAEPVFTALPGNYNIENALAAATAAYAAGVSPYLIQAALAEISVPGRTEIVEGAAKGIAMVDYAHNGIALRNLLQTLSQYHPKRLILIFGCGGERDPHRRVEMAEAAAYGADFTIITSDNPRREDPMKIIGEIAETMKKRNGKFLIEPDRRKAIQYGLRTAGEDDILVVAGKGHETGQVIGTQIRHFDDREELMGKGYK